jgi:hypothetical protein
MPDNPGGGRDGKTATDTSRSAFSAPHLALPKGGGALRGIGETFAANLVTGTGALTVPIPLSPGRSGFGPQLSLFYDSGIDNGPFGFGWRLSLPSITRRTDKGLPRYDDAPRMADTRATDIFLLSVAEDLVPVLVRNGDGDWRVPDEPARQPPPDRASEPRDAPEADPTLALTGNAMANHGRLRSRRTRHSEIGEAAP